MAPVVSATDIIIRTYKRAVGNPDFEWVNVYEAFVLSPSATLEGLQTLADAITDAERPIHTTTVEYVRTTISTWAAEPPGTYDAESFYVREYGAGSKLGTRVLGSDALPRNVVLSTRRQVQIGRSGRLYYRGVLQETDVVTGTSLDWALTAAAKTALDTLLGTARTAMTAALTTWGSAGSFLALIHKQANNSILYRPVVGLEARGVSTRSSDHKYYDRAQP